MIISRHLVKPYNQIQRKYFEYSLNISTQIQMITEVGNIP